jgi:hypothetical protein
MRTLRGGFGFTLWPSRPALSRSFTKVARVTDACDGQTLYNESMLALLLHSVYVASADWLVHALPRLRLRAYQNVGNVFEDIAKSRHA